MKRDRQIYLKETSLSMSRLNKILEMMIEEIMQMNEIKRDQPLTWSLNHMYSCSQIAKLIAVSRDIDAEIAGIAGAIHDLYIIRHGIFEDHGPKGVPLVQDFLNEYNTKFGSETGYLSNDEIEKITKATKYHSDKKNFTEDNFVELIKDVDSLDRYLHGHKVPEYYIPRDEAALKDLKLL